jgi:hypothetical protein
MCHCGLAIYIKKYLKAKRRRIMETQIFHHSKNYIISSKNPFKRNPKKFLQDIRTLELIFKFQQKPKISSFKNIHIKELDLILRP